MISALLNSLRPKQWTKNVLVFAGYVFTIELQHAPDTFWRVLAAFGLFCAVSGATYIINDVVDVEADRKNPKKCKRPIASGEVSARVAITFALVLLITALGASYLLEFYFGVLITAYVILTLCYSALLKHIVIVDLLTITAGFVLRAVAGTFVVKAIDPATHLVYRVEISPWLLVCTTLLALFLGLAKRRGELVTLENGGVDHRKTLSDYTAPMLDQMLTISASCVMMAYFLYTFTPGSKTGTEHPYMMITIPFVIYGLLRYLFLIYNRNAGSSPEQVLLEDKPLLINCVLYVVAAVIALKLS